MFVENREKFRDWLINYKGLSKRCASDVLCRCNRLNKQVLKSIDSAVSSPNLYSVALKEINIYAIQNSNETKQQTTLIITLTNAIKKYCEYKNPKTYEIFPSRTSILK